LAGANLWFTYTLSRRANMAHIKIYSVADRLVASFDSPTAFGGNQVSWTASGLANGVYFYVLEADECVSVEKHQGRFIVLR